MIGEPEDTNEAVCDIYKDFLINKLAMWKILIEKGVVTREEIESTTAIATSLVDQELAVTREREIEAMKKESPAFAAMYEYLLKREDEQQG